MHGGSPPTVAAQLWKVAPSTHHTQSRSRLRPRHIHPPPRLHTRAPDMGATGVGTQQDLESASCHPDAHTHPPASATSHHPAPLSHLWAEGITFIDDDGEAAVWGQPHTLDVVPRGQGQSVGLVAETKSRAECWCHVVRRRGWDQQPTCPTTCTSCPRELLGQSSSLILAPRWRERE